MVDIIVRSSPHCKMAAKPAARFDPIPLGQINLFWFCLHQSYRRKSYRQKCLRPALWEVKGKFNPNDYLAFATFFIVFKCWVVYCTRTNVSFIELCILLFDSAVIPITEHLPDGSRYETENRRQWLKFSWRVTKILKAWFTLLIA